MNNPFYITTPIYYVNDEPHLGHAYTTVLADVLARYARLRGDEVLFLTGTDEHGQKVQNAAQQHGITPQQHADETVVHFQEAWRRLHIANDDFIRTTETRHKRVVTQILQALWDKSDIYLGDYQGWYCVPCERFWTEKDVPDGICPDCQRPVEQLTEANYFFRMSAHQDWLIDYIHAHPNFILPEVRRNEVLGYLRQPLGDLCISRPASRLNWGIPLPFDPGYVTYVWFDALINYVSAAGYMSTPEEQARFERLWSSVTHLIGKDILITHTIYWPTMLHAIGLPQPRTIWAHGWWTSDGEKMSKSRGNVVKPLDMADRYGVDAFRYFLIRDSTLGRDADFSAELITRRYNTDLSNNLGNLLHRLTHMIGRYAEGRVPQPGNLSAEDTALQSLCRSTAEQALALVDAWRTVGGKLPSEALAEVMETVSAINRYLEQTAPWRQAQAGKIERVHSILYTASEALRLTSILLHPVLPTKIETLWARLGWRPTLLRDGLAWGQLVPGSPVIAGEPLFPRIE